MAGASDAKIAALRPALDPEHLNDLAVMAHAAGRRDDALALLATCLLVHPEFEDARTNLEALR